MIGRSKRRRIKRAFDKGIPVSQIAREEGVDRKTVYRIGRDSGEENLPPVVQVSILEQFKAEVTGWVQDGLTAAWIFRELVEKHGFTGSYTTVKRLVAALRPKKPVAAVVRFETAPGDQAQMDWTEFREIDAEGRRVKFWAFSLILSYSRFMYVEFVDRCDTQTIIACHERAFRAIGGVPAEILYDRQSPVYRGQQGRGGEIILNPVFEQFARHWGFEPVLCEAGRGETKGKVERPFRYIKEDFYRPIKVFPGISELNERMDLWLRTRANIRIHATTKERPVDRLAKDQEHLQPLANQRFVYDWSETRDIRADYLVWFRGNRYSVPNQYVGKQAQVWEEGGYVHLAVGGQEVAVHRLSTDKGEIIKNPAHDEGVVRPIRATTRALKEEFLSLFPQAAEFVGGLVQQRTGNVSYHLRQCLGLVELYGQATVLAAMLRAAREHAFHCRWVRQYCESGQVDTPATVIPFPKGKLTTKAVTVQQRPLSVYEACLAREGGA